MANTYLSIKVGGQEYTFGLGNKLGIHPSTSTLLAPETNDQKKLVVMVDGEETPLNGFNTSFNTSLALKGHGGESAVAFNRETVQEIDETLAALIPESFSIDLNSLLLLLNKRPANGGLSRPTRKILGASFGATIDFNQLPILEKIIPPGYELSVNNFQIVVASDLFGGEDTLALKSIIPPETLQLPSFLNKGANLSLDLTLGGEPFTLALPLPQSLPSLRTATNPVQKKSSNPRATRHSSPKAVKRKVGPVQVDSIGLGYKDGHMQLVVYGSITVVGFTLGFIGLSINIPVEDLELPLRLDRVKLSLDGLSLSYEKGLFSLSGTFLRLAIQDQDGQETGRYEYMGQVAITTKKFSITGIGIYTELPDGGSSAFIYASLLAPLGGVPMFFIEGIALGMGYNRGIKPLPVAVVNKFPLVTALYSKNRVQVGASDAVGVPSTVYIKEQFALLSKYLPAVKGQYMVALGLKISTFKLVNSIAVLMMEFGERSSWQIVGTSSLQLPPLVTGLPALGSIELAFRSVFDPEKGLLGVDGILTENSFLLTPDCRLSGGFAFYSWFKGPNAGDFVVTVGGYHPRFDKPAHYPSPARIQFAFDMGIVRFKGQLYAALTSSAIMAGGRFEAFIGLGNITAQFTIALDFIISWLPFYYDARFSISVAVKVYLLFPIEGTISTDLHIWGPEFSGRAKIDLDIYSASFYFGAIGQLKKAPATWDEFNSTFLPESTDILKTNLTRGLIFKQQDSSGVLWHVVEPDQFELKIESQLPVNQIINDTIPEWKTDKTYLEGNQVKYNLQVYEAVQDISAETDWNSENWKLFDDNFTGESFSIAPMGGKQVSNWILNVKCTNSPSGMQFAVTPTYESMPLALWGDRIDPDINGSSTKRLLSGAVITSLASQPPGATKAVDADVFSAQDVVENDPYWQWGVEYVVHPKNPINEGELHPWESGKSYHQGNQVIHEGSVYKCIVGLSNAMNFPGSSWENILQDQKETIEAGIENPAPRDAVAHFFEYQNEPIRLHRMAADLDAAFIGTPQIMQEQAS